MERPRLSGRIILICHGFYKRRGLVVIHIHKPILGASENPGTDSFTFELYCLLSKLIRNNHVPAPVHGVAEILKSRILRGHADSHITAGGHEIHFTAA